MNKNFYICVPELKESVLAKGANSEDEEIREATEESTDFNEALNARMIELRKFSLDYYICVDFFSLGLIRYALKKGLCVDGSKYIEADLSYLEME